MNNKHIPLTTHYSQLITSPNFSLPCSLVSSCRRAIVPSFFFLILFPLALSAQIQPPGYRAEFGSILQSGNMKPFWMISNQGGKFHPENSSMFGGIYMGSEVDRQSGFFVDSVGDRSDRLTLDYGLEVFNRYNGKYDLRLQQYYADVSWWYFRLHAGARKGIGNH